MAITINSTPETYPSAHDSLYFVVTSDNVAEAGFKYVFDVFISSTLVARIKLFPDPVNAKGIFNAAGVVRDYLTNYFKPNTTQTAFAYTGNEVYINYEIRFGEEYGGATYTNLASGHYKAFNFANPVFRDFSTSYYQTFLDKWITSRDKRAMDCVYGEKMYCSFLRSGNNTGKQYVIKVESSNTTLPAVPTDPVEYSGSTVQLLWESAQSSDPYLDTNLFISVNGTNVVSSFVPATGTVTVNNGDSVFVEAVVQEAWTGTGTMRLYIFNQTDGVMVYNNTLTNPTVGQSLTHTFTAQGIAPVTLTVQKYLQGGAADGSPSTGASTILNAFTLVDVSPTALNAYLGSSFITASTYSYGVKINYGGTSSDELLVRLTCQPRWTPVSLHFLNRLGGYDTFTFRLVNKRSASVERKSFQQMDWQYNSASMTRYDAFKRINAGNNTFAVNEEVSFKLTSDYINQSDYLWAKDLITSPEVYMEQGGYYYPVNIKTTTWEERIRAADKMFNFEVTVEFAQKINSQYR